MPLDKPYSEENREIQQDPEVKVARASVHRTLHRLEADLGRLADRIEMTKVVSVGWPLAKMSWHTFKFLRRNPWVWAAAGGVAGSVWVYKKVRYKREPKSSK